MFSENQKISIRQIKRLLILDLFGVSSLLLPSLMAKTVKTDGIFCMVIAALLAVGYIWLMERILREIKGSYYAYVKKLLGSFGSDILMLFYLFFFLLLAAFLLYQLIGMVRTWLLPQGNYSGIGFLILLVAGYGNLRGIEGRARIYEIIFWFLGIPLFLMLFLAVRDVNVNYWTPIADTSVKDFLSGIWIATIFFLPISFLPFLKLYCNKPQKLWSCAKRVVWIVTGLNIVVYLILLGIFQTKTVGILKYPIITLMSMVKLPGGFFERMDTFMIAIWFFSIFALMNTSVFYASDILKELFQEKKNYYGLLFVLILVMAAAEWFFVYSESMQVYIIYMKYLAMPVFVLLPIVLLLIGYFRGRRRVI